jgi:serine/threonine-protein kinase
VDRPLVNAASLVGSTLGDRYRLLEVIGEGGMGRVYRAERLATGQIVALKLLNPEFWGVDQVIQRFEREAKVTSHLTHPNIVQVVEFGAWNGHLFLATELLEGRSLDELIQRQGTRGGRRSSVERALAIMRPVLDALEYAHARGVVHRDLKPQNIMVIPARGRFSRERVKLLDFGIAKLRDDAKAPTQKLTQQGLVLGTPGYMSPEQAVGDAADARSDVYACGVILYEMLAGRSPFAADSSLDIMSAQLNATSASLQASATEARIPAALQPVVLRALSKRPADRFRSVRELRRALERAARVHQPRAAGGTWIRLAVIAAATAILVGDHLKPGALGDGNGRTSSAVGRASSEKARHVPGQARATPKRPVLRDR